MTNAYNRDASDRASDVYDVHYYAHVMIETEAGREARQRLAAKEKVRAVRRRRATGYRESGSPGSFGDRG